ncbi:MAG: glycosyltransferase family 4 protein [Thermostichales cyanobacterium BF4_bins_65]
MHIAWLGKKSPFCGNVTYGREITNGLMERGHRVSFFHFASEAEEGEGGEDDVSLPCLYKSQIYTIPNPRASRVLSQSLQKLQPDLVHASLTLSPMDFSLPDLCQELGLPLVATFHPAFDRRRHLAAQTQQLAYQLYAPSLAHYDCTIVFSQIQREVLHKLGVPWERLEVIPNGVDVNRFCPGPSGIKEELGVERLFVYQGRIAPEKNVEAMLRAWRAARMGPTARLVIVGDGPLLPTLRTFYHERHGVTWLGYVGDEQRRIEILRGADVLILPSLIEGLSLSLLEAMACGVAVVATDVGADGEVLAGGAGILMQPQRVTQDLQTLLPLLRDQPEFTQLLGMKARQRVLERYTLSRNLSRLEQLYQRLCQPKPVAH